MASVASGFQEEGYSEMMKIQEERNPRRKHWRGAESIYSLAKGYQTTDGKGCWGC